jgi:hypothetical protein
MSTRESMTRWDVQYTCDRLGWTPAYDFSWLPEPGMGRAAFTSVP